MTLNIAITEKNEKQYVRLQLSLPRTQEAFSEKAAPDIDRFNDESVVPCDVQVVENTFVDNSKLMVQMIKKIQMIPNKF